MLQQLGNALCFILLAALLPPVILLISRLMRPSFPHAGKYLTYECGELPRGSAYVRFNIRFYMVAIVFLVFDVEIAMLFPVLKLFRGAVDGGNGLPIFLLAFNFMIMLLLGLIYEWKIGDIDWVKDFMDRRKALSKTGTLRTVESKRILEGHKA